MTVIPTVSIGDIIALVTIIVALVVGFVQIRQIYKQMQLSSFAEYTKRYQEIILKLPSDYFTGGFSFDGLNAGKSEEIRRLTRVYFDLCSEEYFLHQEGYVPDKVWKEWESGIMANFSLEHIRAQWRSVEGTPGTYGEFSQYLGRSLKIWQAEVRDESPDR